MFFLCVFAFVLGPFARVLHGKGSGENQHFSQTIFRFGCEQHTADFRINRQLGEIASQLRQRAQLVHCAEFGQQLITGINAARAGRIQKRKRSHIAQTHCLHAQNHCG